VFLQIQECIIAPQPLCTIKDKKNRLASQSLVFGEVEVLNRAMNLAMAANAGNVDFVNMEADQIAAVPLADLQFWADKLFVRGKKNTLLYRKQQVV
jgi:hypothetical protein